MSRFVDYTKLRTLKDVQKQSRRIDRKLRLVKYDVEYDMQNIGQYFTLDYWKNFAIDKLSNAAPNLMSIFMSGKAVAGFFGQRRARRKHH